jgi:Flp pilus assembly protein TadG
MTRRAPAVIPVRRRLKFDGQALVEFALVLPLFLAVICSCVDVGRYVYIRALLTHNVRTAARLAALIENQATDCPSLSAAEVSSGFVVTQDPASISGDTGLDYRTPSNGSGYWYIYPAVATSTSQCTGANRTGVGTPPSVTVRITYLFAPVTPGLGLTQNLTIITSSTQPTGY